MNYRGRETYTFRDHFYGLLPANILEHQRGHSVSSEPGLDLSPSPLQLPSDISDASFLFWGEGEGRGCLSEKNR